MRVMVLNDGQSNTSQQLEAALRTWKQGEKAVLWVDVNQKEEAILKELQANFHLHGLDMRELSAADSRAQLREHTDHCFMILHTAPPLSENVEDYRTGHLGIWVGEQWVITAHRGVEPVIDRLWNRYVNKEEVQGGPDFLLYALSEAVTAGFYPLLDEVEDRIDQTDVAVFQNGGHANIDTLLHIRRLIHYLRRRLGAQRDVISGLVRRDFPYVTAECRQYLQDVYERTLRLFDSLDSFRYLVSSGLDAYLSVLSHRLNETMRKLTVITTIFMPLTLLTGLYGMNFQHMPGLASPWGFWIALAVMVLTGLGMVWFFRRQKWF